MKEIIFGLETDNDVIFENDTVYKSDSSCSPIHYSCEAMGCKKKASVEISSEYNFLYLCSFHAAIAKLVCGDEFVMDKLE